jgi:serine/threonine protein kinase
LLQLALSGGGLESSGARQTSSPDPSEVDQLLDDFEVLELIGVGGMGAVYLARQIETDRMVAIKLLTSERASDPVFQERFLREARTLARLNHPHIVSLYDVSRAGSSWCIIMEYVDGVNLRSLIEDGRLSPNEALRLIPQICDAMQYAHEQGVVHRDIKPENLLVDQNGQIKIADFGLAKIMGDRLVENVTLTDVGVRMGTAGYMAPEQFSQTKDVDHRADIYSLGIIYYEMLTGKRPALDYTPPSRLAEVDDRVDQVVSKSLRESPDERFQSAADVKHEIENIASTPYRATPLHSNFAFAMIAIVLSAVAACIAFSVWISKPNTISPSMTSIQYKKEEPLFLSLPFSDLQADEQQRAWANDKQLPIQIVDDLGLAFQLIPPGEYERKFGHTARITKPFYMGDTEVTVGAFREFVKQTGYRTQAESSGSGGWVHTNSNSLQIESRPEFVWNHILFSSSDDLPVTVVTMADIEAFIEWISDRDGRAYRLPTNAEWTWASYAGNPDRYRFVNGDQASTFGWHGGNSGNRAHSVRQKYGNPWGIHDAFGNACEYTQDGCVAQLPVGTFDNPRQPVTDSRYAGVGGSFADPFGALSHELNGDMPFYSVGFRLAFDALLPPDDLP